MTQEYREGEKDENTRWLVERVQFYDELATRQRAMKEPTAAINAAYARAFRAALSHLTEGDRAQPTTAA